MRVLIVVTHLRGAGHLARALLLARGAVAAGWQAHVATGGFPAPYLDATGVKVHPLVPLRADGLNYSRLLKSDGTLATPADYAQRRAQLVGLVGALHPDVLITELFPYGRRALAREFEASLIAAHELDPRPLVVASVRDILEPPSKPSKVEQTAARLKKWYDATLVHADPDVIRLEQSWPLTPQIARTLHYTGFIAPEITRFSDPKRTSDTHGNSREQEPRRKEILVTAGSGPTGASLFRAASKAALMMHSQSHNRRDTPLWRLLIGAHTGQALRDELSPLANGESLRIEALQENFPALLHKASVFIGQCGYNTAMEALITGTPGVFVPFEGDGEIEQSVRADRFAQKWPYTLVPSRDLTPQNLANAAMKCLRHGKFQAKNVRCNGIQDTIAFLHALHKGFVGKVEI